MLISTAREKDEKKDEDKDQSDDCNNRNAFSLLFIRRELTRQAGNHGIYSGIHTAEIVFFNEIGNHFVANDASGKCIVYTCFKAISCGNKSLSPAVSHFRLDENDRAVVFTFLSDAPFFAQLKGVVRSRVATQVVHGDHINLCGGRVVICKQFLFK